MFRHGKWIVLLSLFFVPCVRAQAPERKSRPEAREVEVHFANGSVVRMNLQQEHLEVATRYGKLTVPTSDIRKIEFGVHLPEGVDKRIEAALKNLGSENFKARDGALRELVALGPYAYPSLTTAAKVEDLEVSQRVQMALTRIREKVPARDLRLREDDLILTPGFTIVGRVVSPSIKARAEYFGDVTLKLPELRTMRWLAGPGEIDIKVDATKYGSNASQWLNTEFQVDASSQLVVTASGSVDLWPQGPGQYVSGPKGYTSAGRREAAFPGTLVGKIGENGSTFIIGERFEGPAGNEGPLYLQIVPSPWNNPSAGSYQVKIATTIGPRGGTE
jgi:hypothetical protein